MEAYFGEFLGTFLLIVFGAGVVANVVLTETKGSSSGWIVITWGWAIGVFVGVFVAGPISGAHINPAVTIGLATAGLFSWGLVIPYIFCQFLGAMLAAFLVYVHYKNHFKETKDPTLKLAVFCTIPAIRDYKNNLFSEIFGTFILVFAVLFLAEPEIGLGSISALPVALLVFGIGLSLGGTTGYAINPARDLGPRIIHALLPIPNKQESDWSYSWVPVLGPMLGGVLAGLVFLYLPF